MRLRTTFTLWVLAILFPLAWIGQVFPQYKRFIDRLMAPEWLHVVSHLLIFAGMVVLLQILQARRGQRVSVRTLLVIVVVVGLLQEFFQFISGPAWFRPVVALQSGLYDLGIDLIGGLIGVAIMGGNIWLRSAH